MTTSPESTSEPSTHANLMAAPAGTADTRLPLDPATVEVAALDENDSDGILQVLADHPSSSLLWAELAEGALGVDSLEGNLAAYAYARTGYHRGLDALRRAGWRGAGPIPWEHEPNRGFLRALWALATAARRIGETDEYERCAQFLRDSSATGYDELSSRA